MSSCEKCYSDAWLMNRRYSDLVAEREASGNICTPEQQAGSNAAKCASCGRMTVHQHTGQPMCRCQPHKPGAAP